MVARSKKVKKDKSEIEKISELLYERTQKWAKAQGLIVEKKSKYSNEAKKLDKLITAMDICNKSQENAIRKLVAEIVKEKIPSVKKNDSKIRFIHGVVVVPLIGDTFNYYTVGEPVLIKNQQGHGIKLDGEQPNEEVTSSSTKAFRPAIQEEIEVLVESLLKIDDFSTLFLGFILDKMGD